MQLYKLIELIKAITMLFLASREVVWLLHKNYLTKIRPLDSDLENLISQF
jgi:hypothetical protein